jgi:hypothetical protein
VFSEVDRQVFSRFQLLLEREIKTLIRVNSERQEIEVERVSFPSQTVEWSSDAMIRQCLFGLTSMANRRLKLTSQ